MTTLSTKCDRSYPLVHPELVEATMLPHCDGESLVNCSAELREISPASAKLLVSGPPELPCRCVLRLVSSKLMRTVEIRAEIGWARPNPAGDWLVECEFDTRLSDAEFSEFLGSGLLERRSAVRFQTRINVAVRWSPDDAQVPALVRDLSEGGLCLMTSHAPKKVREVFVLAATSGGEVTMQLKVRWSLCVGPNFLIGCQFIHGRDFHLLRNLQSNPPAHLTEYSRASRPRDERK
jgi:hypothetical protein